MRWPTGWLGIGVVLGLAACAHTMPADAPVVERVLGDKTLREQLAARGTQDEHFVHEVLHQLGQGPDGIGSLLGSWPNISTTTRRLSGLCSRRLPPTRNFGIGFSRG